MTDTQNEPHYEGHGQQLIQDSMIKNVTCDYELNQNKILFLGRCDPLDIDPIFQFF